MPFGGCCVASPTMTSSPSTSPDTPVSAHGLSLAPLRGLRPAVDDARLGALLSPPYDVIDAARREQLLAGDPDNVVAVILPEPTPEGYASAARSLQDRVDGGQLQVDESPALYVYEMRDADGQVTRGLLGAVELRDPADGVILPHENTMAGPVADRLAVMTATDTDLEPIYLVYDGGGAASALVAATGEQPALAEATTPDGIRHRLWSVTDPAAHADVAADLATRHALIADGHHRYATYRERQRLRTESDGAGPWDRGLALLVDTTEFGPQVHPIHRTVRGLSLDAAVSGLGGRATTTAVESIDEALTRLSASPGFAVALTDGERTVIVTDHDGALADAAARPGEDVALAALDVNVLHRGVIESVWHLKDDVAVVGYAHDVDEAIEQSRHVGGIAVLVRATPVSDVARVAAHGARMPRKSTLFTPKPASGLVLRRLSDQH